MGVKILPNGQKVFNPAAVNQQQAGQETTQPDLHASQAQQNTTEHLANGNTVLDEKALLSGMEKSDLMQQFKTVAPELFPANTLFTDNEHTRFGELNTSSKLENLGLIFPDWKNHLTILEDPLTVILNSPTDTEIVVVNSRGILPIRAFVRDGDEYTFRFKNTDQKLKPWSGFVIENETYMLLPVVKESREKLKSATNTEILAPESFEQAMAVSLTGQAAKPRRSFLQRLFGDSSEQPLYRKKLRIILTELRKQLNHPLDCAPTSKLIEEFVEILEIKDSEERNRRGDEFNRTLSEKARFDPRTGEPIRPLFVEIEQLLGSTFGFITSNEPKLSTKEERTKAVSILRELIRLNTLADAYSYIGNNWSKIASLSDEHIKLFRKISFAINVALGHSLDTDDISLFEQPQLVQLILKLIQTRDKNLLLQTLTDNNKNPENRIPEKDGVFLLAAIVDLSDLSRLQRS